MKYDESMLSAYLDGELSPAEAEVVEKQLAQSAADRELLASLTELHEQLAAIPAETFAEDPVLGVRARIARELAGSQPQSAATSTATETTPEPQRSLGHASSSSSSTAATNEAWRSTGQTQWWKPVIGLATAACLLGVIAWFGRGATLVSQNTDSSVAAPARGGASSDGANLARSIPEEPPAAAAPATEAFLAEPGPADSGPADSGPADSGPAGLGPAAKSRLMPPGGGAEAVQAGAAAANEPAQSAAANAPPQPAMMAEAADEPVRVQALRLESDTEPAGDAAPGADAVANAAARGGGFGGGGEGTAGRNRRSQSPANRTMELYYLGATNDPLELSAADAMDAPDLDRRYVALDISAEQQNVALRFLQTQLQTTSAPATADAIAGGAAVPPTAPVGAPTLTGGAGDGVEAQPAETTTDAPRESLAVLVQAEPQELANLLRSLGRLTTSPSSPGQVALESDDDKTNREEVSATPATRAAAEALNLAPGGLGGLRGAVPQMELGPEARQAVEAGKIWILLRVK